MPEDYADTLTARAADALERANQAREEEAGIMGYPSLVRPERTEIARRAHELAAYAETLLRIARGLREDAAKVRT